MDISCSPETTTEIQRKVLNKEGLVDWKVVEGEPYCWLSLKTITLYKHSHFPMFLHEVAHALAPEPEPLGKGQHFHGGYFANVFTRLTDTYMHINPIAVGI